MSKCTLKWVYFIVYKLYLNKVDFLKKALERKKTAMLAYECRGEYRVRAGVGVEGKILSSISNMLSCKCLWSSTKSTILNLQHQCHLVTKIVCLTKVYSGSLELFQLALILDFRVRFYVVEF